MILTKDQFKKSKWSGGTTTELFISPQGSSYQERNFDIRISSATVDIEESDFTKLPNYNRALMILSGELEIIHQGEYTKKLTQYECDYFEGAWDTSAKGKVTDFNLMTSKSLQASLNYQKLDASSEYELHRSVNDKLVALFLISGKLLSKKDKQLVKYGDLIILQNQDDCIDLLVLEQSQFIQIKVS